MFFSWSNIVHNLNDIHKQAKEVLTQNYFHLSNIKGKQVEVLQKIDQVQKEYSFLTVITSFFGMDKQKSYTDFYSNSSNYEIINDPIEYGFMKSKLILFIQQFAKSLPQLAPILNFDSISNFPLQIDPIEYLLYSTIPSLFGHFWCSELIDQYIDFIFTLNFSNPTFSNRYLELSFTNFIRVTCNTKFFSQSFNSPILSILYYDINMTPKQCAELIISKMHENIFLLPRHIRRLISRFCDNYKEGQIISPSLFVALCIVSPPLNYPKEWGVIDSKYYIDSAGKEKLRQVSDIILGISKNVSETNELTYQFNDFVNVVSEIDEQRDKISISNVLPLLGQESIPLLFSLLDITLLAYLVAHSPCPMLLKGTAEQIGRSQQQKKQTKEGSKKLYNLLFSCNVKSIGQFQIDHDNFLSIDNEQSNSHYSYLSAIFSFFEKANVISDAPSNSLKDFLHFHKKYSNNIKDSKSELALRLIDSLLPDENSQEYYDILPSLNDELRRQKSLTQANSNFFLDLVILNQKFDQSLSQLSNLYKISINAYTSKLFATFIESNDAIQEQLALIYPEILASDERFCDLFITTRPILKDYMKTVKFPQIFDSFMQHFHCWMLYQLPFEKFHMVQPMFDLMGEIIEKADDKVIQLFCVAPAPAKIKHLFQNVPLFEEARSLLQKGRKIENPLIALPSLSAAIEVLNRTFQLEFEDNAQADELTPLIHFLFLTCKIPALFSFIKYLDFYISPLLEKQAITLDENSIVGLTHLINHIDSLYAFLKSNENDDSPTPEGNK